MVFDEQILAWVIAIYFIGFCISVYLCRNEIGEKTTNMFGESYNKTSTDICLKSMCWPGYMILIILFGPFMVMSEIILKLTKNK